MNTIKPFILLLVLGVAIRSSSQPLNWSTLTPEQRHLVDINTGVEFGMIAGLAYHYHFNTRMPIVAGASFSMPAGSTLLDDFKSKAGGQIRLAKVNQFQFSASVYGVYRRYENELVRLQNFGSEMSGVAGYYKPHWFVAGELGFDKAIITQFKHSALYREMYPEVKDGWYEPSTGGNLLYGIQGGVSFKRSDITLKTGRILSQDFKSTPVFPYYLQLGYTVRIN